MYLFPHEPHTVGVAPSMLEGWQSSWVQGITQELTENASLSRGVSIKPACPRMEEAGILTQLIETDCLHCRDKK